MKLCLEKVKSKTHEKKTNVLRIYFNNILPFTARFRNWPLVATYYFFRSCLLQAIPLKFFIQSPKNVWYLLDTRADSIPRYCIRQTNKDTVSSVMPTRALH